MDQFQGKTKHWYKMDDDRIDIIIKEVYKAMRVMGKNKAQSVDGLTDNIF